MAHPALSPGSVVVITGGAVGIGLTAATRFAQLGLRVCIADLGEDCLAAAATTLASAALEGSASVLAQATDVPNVEDLQRPEAAVRERSAAPLGPAESWQRILDVNLWGVIRGTPKSRHASRRSASRGSVRRIAAFRLPVWIRFDQTCQNLQFVFGVKSLHLPQRPDSWPDFTREHFNAEGPGRILMTEGPAGPGGTNRLEIIDV